MTIRRTSGALLAATAALLLATASPALAQGGTGGGGGGGGTTPVPVASCASYVSATFKPNPGPGNVHPLPGQPYVQELGTPPAGPVVAFELTVNNQCIDEGGGPRSSLSVTSRTYDAATGALLFTGVTMQPAGMLMTYRSWVSVPASDAVAPARTVVDTLVKANGQVQDTLTFTAAQFQQVVLTAAATGVPQSLR